MNNEEKKQPEVVSEAAEETTEKAVLETVAETEAAENAAAEAPAEEKAEKAAPAKEPSFLKKLFSGKKARKSADMQRRLRHGRTARVLTVEHEILPESVRLFCAEKLGVDGRQVHVL